MSSFSFYPFLYSFFNLFSFIIARARWQRDNELFYHKKSQKSIRRETFKYKGLSKLFCWLFKARFFPSPTNAQEFLRTILFQLFLRPNLKNSLPPLRHLRFQFAEFHRTVGTDAHFHPQPFHCFFLKILVENEVAERVIYFFAFVFF